MAPGLALFAALLVPKLSVVNEPADGWHRVGRHLDQVETPLAGHLERVKCWNDADLLAVLVDQPDLANPDAFIDPCLDGSGNNLPPLPIAGYRNNTGTRRGQSPARSPLGLGAKCITDLSLRSIIFPRWNADFPWRRREKRGAPR